MTRPAQVLTQIMQGGRGELDIAPGSGVEQIMLNQADPHQGRRRALGRHTRTVVAHQMMFHDAERPSQIVLPIIPDDRRPG